MALIYQARFRALDDDGNPMPFAELYTRDNAAHSTPKTTYTSSALSVENSNPLVADDAGYFAQMYADESTEFYLILVASGGNPSAPYRTYSDVVALGGLGTGALLRTFSDSRYEVTSGDNGLGNLGTVVSYGSASPTDTGGYLLEQGWDGTQGTRRRSNFAENDFLGNVTAAGNASVAGRITGGSSDSFYTLIRSGAITASASTDIRLDETNYNAYRLEVTYVRPSAALDLALLLAFDATPTFKTGATDYIHQEVLITDTPSSSASLTTSTAGDTSLKLYHYAGALHANGFSKMVIEIASRAGQETVVTVETWVFGDNNNLTNIRRSFAMGSTNAKNYGVATYARLITSAGNITARYALFGKPGF